eukprot:scaffold10548_cov110-Skeletonema_dohrnii-CCMP3373.AAC.2
MSDMGRADTGELLHRLGRSEPVFKMPEREAAAPTGAVGMFQQSDEQGKSKATPEQEAASPTAVGMFQQSDEQGKSKATPEQEAASPTAVGMFEQSDEQNNIKATPDESCKNQFEESYIIQMSQDDGIPQRNLQEAV